MISFRWLMQKNIPMKNVSVSAGLTVKIKDESCAAWKNQNDCKIQLELADKASRDPGNFILRGSFTYAGSVFLFSKTFWVRMIVASVGVRIFQNKKMPSCTYFYTPILHLTICCLLPSRWLFLCVTFSLQSLCNVLSRMDSVILSRFTCIYNLNLFRWLSWFVPYPLFNIVFPCTHSSIFRCISRFSIQRIGISQMPKLRNLFLRIC